MKKLLKKVILMIIVCVLTISVFSAATVQTDFDMTDCLTEIEDQYYQKYRQAKLANKEIKKLFDISSEGEYIYPDFYGGSYITKDGKLLLRIIQDRLDQSAKVNEFFSVVKEYNDVIILENTDISFSELRYLARRIVSSDLVMYGVSVLHDFSSHSLRIFVPRDTLAKQECNEAQFLEIFVRILGEKTYSNYITKLQFEFTDDVTTLIASLHGGDKLYSYDSNYGTAGLTYIRYNAYGQPINSMLTAGHVADYNLFSTVALDNSIGTVVYNSLNSSYPSADYAIINVSSSHTINNNQIKISSSQYATISLFANYSFQNVGEGDIVYKYGATTGFTFGECSGEFYASLITNRPNNLPNITVQNTMWINPMNSSTLADRGDSGGPVWYIDESGNRVFQGINTAIKENDNVLLISLLSYMNLNP